MQSTSALQGYVEQLERELQTHPRAYKLKLAGLAAVGFLVLGGAALLAVAISAGLVVGLYLLSPVLLVKLIKVIWIPVAFGWVVIRALWIKFAPPDGYRLEKGKAPALEAEVERLRVATGAPKLDGIIIDSDLNAAAATVPQALGLLGQKHYLVLGLPLMQLLDRDQLSAVIAHEFGHFGGGHNRFTGWIYHVRLTWYRVLGALNAGGSWAGRWLGRFFDWYAPRFSAYSFPLARAQEYEADAIAGRVVGVDAMASALVRVHLGGERLHKDFWPGVQRAVRSEPSPPKGLFGRMAEHLRGPEPDAEVRLGHALSLVGGYDDTHPTLAQRLRALGVPPRPPEPIGTCAADALLGPLHAQLQARFSDEWAEHQASTWSELHKDHVNGLARLQELDGRTGLGLDDSIEHARLVEDFRSEDEVIGMWRALIERAPEHAAPQYRLGCLLLNRDEPEGVGLVTAAMELDPDAVEPGAQTLADYFHRHGDFERRDAMVQRLRGVYAQDAKSDQERAVVRASDRFEQHGLTEAQLAAACAQLAGFKTVGKVWIVRKPVSTNPSALPHYVVLVAWRGLVLSENGKLQAVVDALELPGSFMAVTTTRNSRLNRRIKKVAGAPTYRR